MLTTGSTNLIKIFTHCQVIYYILGIVTPNGQNNFETGDFSLLAHITTEVWEMDPEIRHTLKFCPPKVRKNPPYMHFNVDTFLCRFIILLYSYYSNLIFSFTEHALNKDKLSCSLGTSSGLRTTLNNWPYIGGYDVWAHALNSEHAIGNVVN